MSSNGKSESVIEVSDLTMAYGSFVVMRDLSFNVLRGEIKVLMGGSGCGKSTLLRHLIGAQAAAAGTIRMFGEHVRANHPSLDKLRRRFGVLYQAGALWSSMTLEENIALPLEEYTSLKKTDIRDIVRFKLALVGLAGFEKRYPAELSGGMRKRAGLARAMALDPEILFFDEPSAGLDPLSSRRLDELIVSLRDSTGATVVIVTHELDSIFTIADTAIFLDVKEKTATADGDPQTLKNSDETPRAVRTFLNRGKD